MKQFLVTVLITLSAVAAQAKTYTCNGMGENKGNTVTLTIVSEAQVKIDDDYANLDESYSPRLNADLQRFEYKNVEDEGTSEALIQSQLLQGADRGLIKLQQRGEIFGSQSYYCHP